MRALASTLFDQPRHLERQSWLLCARSTAMAAAAAVAAVATSVIARARGLRAFGSESDANERLPGGV